MLDAIEATRVAAAFGVAQEQVRRDHFLSHLLAGLAAVPQATERMVFFGGTALARTHLVHGRLSEDIDLLARSNRRELAADIAHVLDRRTRREFGALQWDPALSVVRGSEAAVVRAAGSVGIRVQLLSARSYPDWPTEVRDIEQRYTDVPSTRLRVLTRSAFVVSKTAAFVERSAPRDLFDLHALAELGAIDADAARLYVRLGPTGQPPGPSLFRQAPDESQWQRELEAQTTLTITAGQALERVRRAWTEAARA